MTEPSWISRNFVGAAFEDTLYQTDNNERERACCWKIMRTFYHFALAKGSWKWKAIGIPLDLFDNSVQGDIDILVAMDVNLVFGPLRKHSYPPVIYRCFEVKTSKISRDGEVKSLKLNRFYKTVSQLQKLSNLGAQQTFLLEAFIVEAGFTPRHPIQVMPDAVRAAVSEKYDSIVGSDFGYVVLGLEQIEGYSEGAHIHWPLETIKEANTLELRNPIKKIALEIDNYVKNTCGYGVHALVTYCDRCKKLTRAHPRGPYICDKCGKPVI